MGISLDFFNMPVVTTTNATVTAAGTYPIPDDQTVLVEMSLMARSSTGVSAAWGVRACVKRVGGGNVLLVGAIAPLFTPRKDAGATAWDATFVLVGDSIEIRVLGAANTSIAWFLEGKLSAMLAPGAQPPA